jgi:hypothetical protein
MLIPLADRLATSRRDRLLFFGLLTLGVILLTGYHFGTFDQAVHIPFLKRIADPSLFPGDAFLDLRRTHYSFFWFAFVPAYRFGLLEPTLFGAHVAATYLTFAMLWALGRRLAGDPLAALIACLAFAVPHIGFASFPVFEFSLLNRTFALPFLLLVILWYLEGRIERAFALLGVVLNLHALSATFVLALLLFDGALRRREIGGRRIAAGLGLAALAALPVLAWRVATPREVSALALAPDWLDILSRSLLYNVFHLLGPMPYLWVISAFGFASFGLFWVARRSLPPGPHDRAVNHFMLAVLAIVLLQPVVANALPVVLLVQLQIVRAGLFALIFGYLTFAGYLAVRLRASAQAATRAATQAGTQTGTQTGIATETGREMGAADGDGPEAVVDLRLPKDPWDARDDALIVGSFVVLTPPIGPLAVHTVQRLVAGRRARAGLACALIAVTYASSFLMARHYDMWSLGIHVYAQPTPWVEAQLWARDHTPKDARFITPPQIYWLYEPDWRVHSERSTVATLTEVLEMAFAPEYLAVWQPRFEAVAPGALARFRGDVFENRRLTAEAYDSLSDAQIAAVADRYGASYAVVARPRLRGFPIAYENQDFVIYDLR